MPKKICGILEAKANRLTIIKNCNHYVQQLDAKYESLKKKVRTALREEERAPFCAFSRAFWSLSCWICCMDSSNRRCVSEFFDNRSDSSARTVFNCTSYGITSCRSSVVAIISFLAILFLGFPSPPVLLFWNRTFGDKWHRFL